MAFFYFGTEQGAVKKITLQLRCILANCNDNLFGQLRSLHLCCICICICVGLVLLCILVNCNDNLSHQLLWQLRSLRQNALALLLRSLGLTLDLLTQLTLGKTFKVGLYYRYFQEVM